MNKYLPAFSLTATRVLLLTLALSGMVFTAHSDEHNSGDNSSENPSRLFQQDERLNMRLEAPFYKLFKKRGEKRPYFPAAIIYKDDKGQDVKVQLKLRVRGNFRAKKENCRFPPLKLNFNKKELAGTIFDGEDQLKLVTHCKSASKYEQFVLLEYMAYRMQNLLTDYSLRARAVTIEYYDSDKEKVIDTKVAFIIEDQARMAQRVRTERVKVPRIEKVQYNQDLLHLATVFQYMLGNTDYSVILGPKGDNCCHNIIPLKDRDGSMIPVPYDFDATGLVNAPYVSPPENLGIRSTRERLYRGYCQNTQGFKNSFAVFHDKREAIFNLFNGQAELNDKSVKSTLRFLEDFYKAISSEDKIVSEFIEKCRK